MENNNKINLLIIGAGSAGAMVAREITGHKETSEKYNIIGFIDDDSNKKDIDGKPVLGRIIDAKNIIKKNRIKETIISIPSADKNTIDRILTNLSETNIKIKIVPGLYEIIEGNVSLKQIRNLEPEDILGREEIGFDLDRLGEFYRNKKVFITGAGGSIGSEILLQLLKLPIKNVAAFGHGENSIAKLILNINNDKRFSYIIGDIKDTKKLNHEINKFNPDVFFHAAAHKHVPLMEDYPDEAVKNNIIGTYNCVQAAIKNNIERFILISTDKAVNPTSVMGMSKRIAEKIILSFNNLQNKTKFSLTRFGNVLSSRGSVIPIFLEQIERGEPITITDPEMKRYFMSIPEAARLVIKSGSIKNGKIFVLDMGEPVKIVELAKKLLKLYGYNEDKLPIIYTGLRPGEKLFEEISFDSELLKKSEYEKLLISNENQLTMSIDEIESMIDEFREVAETYDNDKIKSAIKKYL